MENLETILQEGVRQGVIEGVKNKLGQQSYNSPLQKMMDAVVQEKVESFRGLLAEAISKAVSDQEFRNEIIVSTRSLLAKLLVQRFGGEIEKQINALKSDPTTRARITLAIEGIVSGKD